MEKLINQKNMERILIFVLSFFIISCSGWGQNRSKNATNNIDKHNFNNFLNLFIDVKTPFNYKKELTKVRSGSVKLLDIPEKEAILFLDMKENDLYKTNMLYNYDTDERTFEKVKNLPVAHLKFPSNNFWVIIYRMNKGSDDDTTLVYLRTIDLNGKSIDKMILGEQFTKENDWMSFVFLDQNHFKVFKYEVNWANFQKKGQYYYIIDKDSPQTTVVVTDFHIDENGKIKKVKEYPKQFLKNEIFNYRKYDPDTDDIMNQY